EGALPESDRVQPCPERCSPVEAPDLLPGGEEYFLGYVRRIVRAGREPAGHRKDARVVACHEPVERLQVAPPTALDRPLVFRPWRRSAPVPLRGRLHERGRSGVALHHVASLIPPAARSSGGDPGTTLQVLDGSFCSLVAFPWKTIDRCFTRRGGPVVRAP